MLEKLPVHALDSIFDNAYPLSHLAERSSKLYALLTLSKPMLECIQRQLLRGVSITTHQQAQQFRSLVQKLQMEGVVKTMEIQNGWEIAEEAGKEGRGAAFEDFHKWVSEQLPRLQSLRYCQVEYTISVPYIQNLRSLSFRIRLDQFGSKDPKNPFSNSPRCFTMFPPIQSAYSLKTLVLTDCTVDIISFDPFVRGAKNLVNLTTINVDFAEIVNTKGLRTSLSSEWDSIQLQLVFMEVGPRLKRLAIGYHQLYCLQMIPQAVCRAPDACEGLSLKDSKRLAFLLLRNARNLEYLETANINDMIGFCGKLHNLHTLSFWGEQDATEDQLERFHSANFPQLQKFVGCSQHHKQLKKYMEARGVHFEEHEKTDSDWVARYSWS